MHDLIKSFGKIFIFPRRPSCDGRELKLELNNKINVLPNRPSCDGRELKPPVPCKYSKIEFARRATGVN